MTDDFDRAVTSRPIDKNRPIDFYFQQLAPQMVYLDSDSVFLCRAVTTIDRFSVLLCKLDGFVAT